MKGYFTKRAAGCIVGYCVWNFLRVCFTINEISGSGTEGKRVATHEKRAADD